MNFFAGCGSAFARKKDASEEKTAMLDADGRVIFSSDASFEIRSDSN